MANGLNYIEFLQSKIDLVKTMLKTYPDLNVIEDWGGIHFSSKSVNKIVSHFSEENMYIRFYIRYFLNGSEYKIYSYPSFGCRTDSSGISWIDTAIQFNINPNTLYDAAVKLAGTHTLSIKEFKKITEYKKSFK